MSSTPECWYRVTVFESLDASVIYTEFPVIARFGKWVLLRDGDEEIPVHEDRLSHYYSPTKEAAFDACIHELEQDIESAQGSVDGYEARLSDAKADLSRIKGYLSKAITLRKRHLDDPAH